MTTPITPRRIEDTAWRLAHCVAWLRQLSPELLRPHRARLEEAAEVLGELVAAIEEEKAA